jgi:hypothetical protein
VTPRLHWISLPVSTPSPSSSQALSPSVSVGWGRRSPIPFRLDRPWQPGPCCQALFCFFPAPAPVCSLVGRPSSSVCPARVKKKVSYVFFNFSDSFQMQF